MQNQEKDINNKYGTHSRILANKVHDLHSVIHATQKGMLCLSSIYIRLTFTILFDSNIES